MYLKTLIKALEKWAPLSDAEGFDNVGLQIGNPEQEINKALITLDVTDEVVDEAINKDANLIITFHPLIFKPLKNITSKNRVSRLALKCIENKIALYAIHTNLDAQLDGVNAKISEKLGLENRRILIPNKDKLFKLIYFVPENSANEVRDTVFMSGAGAIGNYSECSFNTKGTGTFKPMEGANPTLGQANIRHEESEIKVEIILEQAKIQSAIYAMKSAHPYEEVAYDLIHLSNESTNKGMGQIGELKKSVSEKEFLEILKNQFNVVCVRHSNLLGKKIKKVAVLGGSGAFGINNAIREKADAYVTADLKYHDFFLADNQIIVFDIGHYESEQFTKNHINNYMSKIFPNFAVLISEVNTNSIKYY